VGGLQQVPQRNWGCSRGRTDLTTRGRRNSSGWA